MHHGHQQWPSILEMEVDEIILADDAVCKEVRRFNDPEGAKREAVVLDERGRPYTR